MEVSVPASRIARFACEKKPATGSRGMAEIGLICVHPAHRGHGYGRSIVRGLMGWAGAMGCRDAYLQVEQGNAVAINLYAGLGFRPLYEYETRIRDV